MAGVGYNTGLMKGMAAASEMQSARSREEALMEQMQTSRLKQAMEIQEYTNKMQERKLLQDAFMATSPDRIEGDKVNKDEILGQQFVTAGKAMLMTDPKTGLAMIKEGNDLLGTSAEGQHRLIQAAMGRQKIMADVATTVHDQETLTVAVEKAASLGEKIPEQFRQWNPASEEWWKRFANTSESAYRQGSLAARLDKIELDKEKLLQDKEKEAARNADRDRAFELQKSRHELGKYTAPKFKELKKYAGLLPEMDERFGELDDEALMAAAADVDARTYAHSRKPNIDFATARKMAVDEVASRIGGEDKDEYKGFEQKQYLPEEQVKAKLGAKFKPGYVYWVENGRLVGAPK
jgi:hypothetical protein